MLKLKKLRLNQKGFGSHLIMPVLVVVAVAGVGTYLLKGSKAATQAPAQTAAMVNPCGVALTTPSGTKITAPSQAIPYAGFDNPPDPRIINYPDTVSTTQNSTGGSVQGLHGALAMAGIYDACADPINTFGPKTEAAVKYFQSFWGLRQNGVVDKTTWKALFQYLDGIVINGSLQENNPILPGAKLTYVNTATNGKITLKSDSIIGGDNLDMIIYGTDHSSPFRGNTIGWTRIVSSDPKIQAKSSARLGKNLLIVFREEDPSVSGENHITVLTVNVPAP